MAGLKIVLRGQTAQDPWKGNCPDEHASLQTPH